MIPRRLLLALVGVASAAAVLAWLAAGPIQSPPPAAAPAVLPPTRFRLGLIPDRNLYQQRRAYLALAQYLDTHVHPSRGISTLDDPPPIQVELVTSHNYAGILKDFAREDVDGAFLGSLVALLAVDRYGAQVLAKSENLAGRNTYAGTLFVRADSPITSLADLTGTRLAAVRTTMAGSIFPLFAFQNAAIPREEEPRICWSGTHDDVIDDVLARRVDAGAVKDLRLDSYQQEHPEISLRRLATGPRAPDNAFVVSGTLSPDLRDALVAALLHMQQDPDARPVLKALQLRRFAPCDLSEYNDLVNMVEIIRPRWSDTGVDGPPPKRPAAPPASAPAPGNP